MHMTWGRKWNTCTSGVFCSCSGCSACKTLGRPVPVHASHREFQERLMETTKQPVTCWMELSQSQPGRGWRLGRDGVAEQWAPIKPNVPVNSRLEKERNPYKRAQATECKLCGQTETMDHILFWLFRCVVAQFSWCVSGTCLNGMQFQCADSDGSRNKFMGRFLLHHHLAPPSLVLHPQICRGALEGLHWISSGMGARAPSAPPLVLSPCVEMIWLIQLETGQIGKPNV
jgi:hypothetical protein